ncbi:MAG TPA: hypothetical protein PLQ19_07970 [Aeromicrobium sp.]|nr:hypothetical protein [Aeromicrobium sp.]
MKSFGGLSQMLWLAARRERSWIAWTTLVFVGTFLATAAQMSTLAPTLADRINLQKSLSLAPAMTLLLGRFEHPETVASTVGWRVGLFMAAALAVMAALTVVRHTRAEEEAGRLELLAAGRLGRGASLAAAILAALVLVLVTSAASSAALFGRGASAGQLAGHSVGLAVPALVAIAVAAVAAQMTATARAAKAVAICAVLLAYALRGFSDLRGLETLTALNPFGWYTAVDPFGDFTLRPVFVALAVSGFLVWVAFAVALRRDLGAGLFAVGSGRPRSRFLAGPGTLVARLGWRTLVGWLLVMALMGAFVGSLLPDLGDFVDTTPQFKQILESLGGVGAIADSYVAVMAQIFGIAAACWAIAQVGSWRTEESTGRLEAVLATGISRSRMLLSLSAFSFAGVVLLQVSAGLATGLSAGAMSADGFSADGLTDALVAELVRVPPAWLLASVGLLLVSWRPAWFGLAWLLVLVSVLFGIYGDLLGIPASLRGVSVFQHVPNVPIEPLRWAPLIAMTAIALGILVLAVVLLNRRDVPAVDNGRGVIGAVKKWLGGIGKSKRRVGSVT